MFSSPIWGTNTNKLLLSWWDYWVGHVWITGWWTIYEAYINWADLVLFEDNQQNYALLKTDDPFEQCRDYFWDILGEDNVYPKDFLEHLQQMAHDVKTGKVKTYPMKQSFFDDIDDLLYGDDE